MILELQFERQYDIEVLGELGREERYYYPDGNKNKGQDGMIIKVMPSAAEPWFAIFAFGDISPKATSGVYAMPDGVKFCVISKGAGYIVSSLDPLSWEVVKAYPIMDVRSVEEMGLIVFSTYTELVAYNSSSVQWKTKRITLDGLVITNVHNNILYGQFWNPRSESEETFEVDLRDGTVK
jgi:hypothetical protein